VPMALRAGVSAVGFGVAAASAAYPSGALGAAYGALLVSAGCTLWPVVPLGLWCCLAGVGAGMGFFAGHLYGPLPKPLAVGDPSGAVMQPPIPQPPGADCGVGVPPVGPAEVRQAGSVSSDAMRPKCDAKDNNASSPAWRDALAVRLENLSGPPHLTRLYRAKGLEVLRDASNMDDSENSRGIQKWLERFERLLLTLEDIPVAQPEKIAAFNVALQGALDKIWGNDHVKYSLRQCAAMHHEGGQDMQVLCVTGESGSGKNYIADAIASCYTLSRSIDMTKVRGDELTGFMETYKDPQPSIVARLMMEAPGQHRPRF
jgi:hypothetical protein